MSIIELSWHTKLKASLQSGGFGKSLTFKQEEAVLAGNFRGAVDCRGRWCIIIYVSWSFQIDKISSLCCIFIFLHTLCRIT